MKSPIGLAMWISKFVFTLVLMLVVLPAGLIYGNIYAYGRYEAWQEAKAAAKEQVAQAAWNAKEAACVARMRAATPTWDVFDKVAADQRCTNDADAAGVNLEPPSHPVPPPGFMLVMSQEDLAREWARQQACKKSHWKGSGCAALLQRQACAMGAIDSVCLHSDFSRAVCFNADGTQTPCKKSSDPYAAIAEPIDVSAGLVPKRFATVTNGQAEVARIFKRCRFHGSNDPPCNDTDATGIPLKEGDRVEVLSPRTKAGGGYIYKVRTASGAQGWIIDFALTLD